MRTNSLGVNERNYPMQWMIYPCYFQLFYDRMLECAMFSSKFISHVVSIEIGWFLFYWLCKTFNQNNNSKKKMLFTNYIIPIVIKRVTVAIIPMAIGIPQTTMCDTIRINLNFFSIEGVSLTLGKGSLGSGTSKNLHKGSQPSLTSKTSNRSFGTVSFTCWTQSL